MSGLCGWLGPAGDAKPAASVLAGMTAASLRATPSSGHGSAGQRGALHVQDVGGQSRFLEDGRYLVAISGSPSWSLPDLAARAAERGHADALLEAFRRHGLELFDFLRGAFSLALLDLDAGEAILAIDRFGVEAMYVAESRERLVFGANADAVRAHPAVPSSIDPQGIYNYFNYYTVPADGTVYKEQRKLLPGQLVHYRDGVARRSFYWSLDYAPESAAPTERLAEELHELLLRSVARMLRESEGIATGAFLSGGLDSSTVAGMMQKATGAGPRTFTVGFEPERYDEMHFARIAARHFGAEAHEHYLTAQEAADAIPRIAAFYDEPFGNSSAIPAYYCARSAAERGIGLLLAGDGGDELFAGNARYAQQVALERYFRLASVVPGVVIGPALALLGRAGIARRARNYLTLLTTPLPDRMLAYEHLGPDDARTIFAAGFLSEVDLEAPLAIARETYNRTSLPAILNRMMHMDLRLTLADNDLRKVTAMCRMAGVAVRFPFLDEDLAAFAAKIPPEILLENGELRAFYKKAMRGFLPQEIIEKQKHGFGMPYDIWIQQDRRIRQIAVDAAHSFVQRKICNAGYVEALLKESGAGDGQAASRLWDVMMLELWLQAHGMAVS